jgi:hypothetical protein
MAQTIQPRNTLRGHSRPSWSPRRVCGDRTKAQTAPPATSTKGAWQQWEESLLSEGSSRMALGTLERTMQIDTSTSLLEHTNSQPQRHTHQAIFLPCRQKYCSALGSGPASCRCTFVQRALAWGSRSPSRPSAYTRRHCTGCNPHRPHTAPSCSTRGRQRECSSRSWSRRQGRGSSTTCQRSPPVRHFPAAEGGLVGLWSSERQWHPRQRRGRSQHTAQTDFRNKIR